MQVLEGLNEEQKAAVTHGEGPLLIVAGAGTGKTTVITRRLAWLVETKRARPEEILVLTFTEKAAEEMEERIDVLLPYGYLDLWVSTFHAFGERILRAHGLDIGLPTNFKVLSETEQWMLLKRHFDRLSLDYYRPLGNPTRFLHALVRHFSRAKDEAVTPEEYLCYTKERRLNLDRSLSSEAPLGSEGGEAARLEELSEAYHTYCEVLREEGALDFGDLIVEAMRLFKTRPTLLAQYRKQFKYILVDEFQDTNWAQYELVKLLAAPNNNLTVTGDDDQSIYKFRGASIANILSFKRDYPQCREVVLSSNYRSRQNILDLAYRFIQKNDPNRLEVQLAGEVTKQLAAQNPGEGIVEHLQADTEGEEARLVVTKILALKEQASDSTWSDFAILVRANREAHSFTQALDASGIPYQFLASSGLFAKPIVLDLLAYLKLLDNYHESASLYRVLVSRPYATRHEDLSKLTAWARRKSSSLYEVLNVCTTVPGITRETCDTVARLLALVERHTRLARSQTATRVLFAHLKDSGLLEMLSKDKSREGIETINYLTKFFKHVEAFERSSPEKTVRTFVEAASLAIEAGDEGALSPLLEEGPDTVKVLTVHSAKGLEFRFVFVANVVDKRFPTIERPDPIPLDDALIKEQIPPGDLHLEEERRLLYVAMTRAKEGLFFTSAEDYGGARKKKPSRFLYELGFVTEETKKRGKRPTGKVAFVLRQPAQTHATAPRASQKGEAPLRFSFTQLKAYETCPYQYRFAHVLQIPVEGKATFSFGKTIHKTLELFFRRIIEMNQGEQGSLFASHGATPHHPPVGGGTGQAQNSPEQVAQRVPSEDELLKMYEENWIDDWYESKEHQEEYREKGKKMLREFYRTHQGHFPVPKYLEQAFNLKIGPHTLHGVVDRIDILPSGAAEIIDYKTGKAPARLTGGKDEKSLGQEDTEQLLIYQMAAQDVLKLTPELLSFYYLNENRKVSFLGKDEEISRLKEKITSVIQEVQKGHFTATPDVWKCRACDFNSICEFRKLS